MEMASLFIGFVCFLLLVECSSSRDCGRSNTTLTDVEKSEDAEANAWPWMVAFTKIDNEGKQVPWCNGFLIDDQHVLTVATCFGEDKPDLYSTSIGDIDHTKGQKYSIKNIYVHPGFRYGDFYDDIALLTLDTAVNDSNVSPICLPRSKEFRNITGMETVIAGWADTKFGEITMTLKQLNAGPVITNRICRHSLGAAAPYSGYLCAGFMEEGKQVFCGGDSGSPLMLKTDDKWYAVGISSFGIMCRPEFPVGYTRVLDYLNWIDEIREEEE